MVKFPPWVVALLAALGGAANGVIVSVANLDSTVKAICVGVIALVGTFGVSHNLTVTETTSTPVQTDSHGPDPYAGQ